MLYSWGANSHGQLGLGFQSEQQEIPQLVTDIPFKKIRKITGGGGHVLILDTIGKLYSCGYNNKGQLGIGSTDDKNLFQGVQFPEDTGKIVNVSCGWDSSAAISTKGDLYVWGSNSFNQLGISNITSKFSSKPIKMALPIKEKVMKVKLGLRYTSILTESNSLYFLGKSKCLDIIRLLPNTIVDLYNNVEFLKFTSKEKLCKMSCGQNHVIIETVGKFLMFGDNKFNQCGNGEFLKLEKNIVKIVTGWTHNAYLTIDGEVFLWGRNNYGQLGMKPNKSNIDSPTKLEIEEHVSQINLGSEHGLAVTENGKVLTFGWNEHGNCGNGNTENLFHPYEVLLNGKCIKSGTGAGFCYALIE